MSVLPPFYYYFFWLVEPGMSFAGAAYAIFRPEAYALDLLPPNIERFTQIIGNTMRGRMAISQLGSCFCVLAMNSAFLLPAIRRQTPAVQETIMAAFLMPLLIGDFLHIALTLLALPADLMREPWRWTQLIHGNVDVTIGLVIMRVLWFLRVGRSSGAAASAAKAGKAE